MAWQALVAALFDPLVKCIDDLTLSKEEKANIKLSALTAQVGMSEKVLDYESRLIEAQASVITAEAKGESWLQRSWRPIIMLGIGLIIFNNYVLNPYLKAIFDWAVFLELPEDLWTLMKIGLGGYIVGRSGEKIAASVADGMRKNNAVVE